MVDKVLYQQLSNSNSLIPRILCKRHKNQQCDTINLKSKENQSIFICMDCAIEDQLQITQLMSMKKLFSENQNEIIPNWPFFMDNKLHQQLNRDFIRESYQISDIDQVNAIFNTLRDETIRFIEEHRKKVIIHVNQIEQQRQTVIQKYAAMSDKEKMMKKIIALQSDQKKMEDYIRNEITEKEQKKLENHKVIQDCLDRFNKQKSSFEIDHMNKLVDKLINNIQSLSFLVQNKNLEEKQANEQIQLKESPITKKLQYIDAFGLQEQPNNEESTLEGDYSKLEIIKTNYYQSQNNVKINKLPNGHIEIITDNKSNIVRQVYINEEIFFDKKYEILVSIDQKNKTNRDIFLGLLPFSKKDQAGWQSQLSLYSSFNSMGISYSIMGQHPSSYIDDLRDILFQIHLKQSYLYCFIEANGTKNLLYKFNWEDFKDDEKYYFYIAMINPNVKVIIKDFQVVEKFRNLYS